MNTYVDIISKKTASFFAACAETGAVAAGSDHERVEKLRDAFWNFGVAFQMIDDVLDFTADPEDLGKPVFQDLVDGKVTLPIIHMLNHGDEHLRIRLRDIISKRGISDADHEFLSQRMRQLDVLSRCADSIDEYLKKAVIPINGPGRAYKCGPHASAAASSLEDLADYILNRNGLGASIKSQLASAS